MLPEVNVLWLVAVTLFSLIAGYLLGYEEGSRAGYQKGTTVAQLEMLQKQNDARGYPPYHPVFTAPLPPQQLEEVEDAQELLKKFSDAPYEGDMQAMTHLPYHGDNIGFLSTCPYCDPSNQK